MSTVVKLTEAVDQFDELELEDGLSVDDDEKENDTTEDDFEMDDVSVSRILRFAIPAMGIWLCSPLLSVIDTSFVGMLSGTIQQAALNPAVAVTEYTGKLMCFLFTATTNLIATSFETDRSTTTADTASTTSCREKLMAAFRVSLWTGTGIGIFLLLASTPMLRALIRSDGTDDAGNSAVLAAAQTHVWIRAFGMPAAAMVGTAQAACLGMQDTYSPLMTTLLAAAVDVPSNLLLVGHDHPWIGGVAGAAWATILSQEWVALGCYLYWLYGEKIPGESTWQHVMTMVQERWSRVKDKLRRSYDPLKPETATPPSTVPVVQYSVRGLLRGHDIQARDFFIGRHDQPDSVDDFRPYIFPVTMTQIGRASLYITMGIVVAGMAVESMAANQIVSAFFFAFVPVADSLGQTAQALLPPILSRKTTVENQRQYHQALKNFGKVSLGYGVVLSALYCLIPFLTKMIMTSDPNVHGVVNSVVPIFILVALFLGVFYSAEGILLAQKDLKFVGGMYSLYFAVFPILILQLPGFFGSKLQLWHVWASFMVYHLLRMAVSVIRVMVLSFRRLKQTLA